MNVIAHKKDGIGFMYICVVFVGLIFIGAGFAMNMFYSWILGAVIGVTGGVIFIKYVRLPHNIIWLEGDKLCHPRGSLELRDVVDVSYRRASAKGIQYRWGSVTLVTHIETFKYGFIADCEEVTKRITDMVYRAKHDGKEETRKDYDI